MKNFRVLLVLLICFVVVFGSETEIISKRSFTSKTYSVGNGQLKQVVYPYPIHYLSGNEYISIPEGQDTDYYSDLATSQMKGPGDKFGGPSRTESSISNSGYGGHGMIYDNDDGTPTYFTDSESSYLLGMSYYFPSTWTKYRMMYNWHFLYLVEGYVIDSTVYQITLSSANLTLDDLQIQWMFVDWDYNWIQGEASEWDAVTNGNQIGTITLTDDISSSQTKKIKWNSGSGLSDTLQNQIDDSITNFAFYSGLKTNRESGTESNIAYATSELITIYYHPPQKTIAVDNTIYNTSTSIGGELEITSGTLPPETDPTNDAGDDIVLYEDSTYTILEPEDEITYSSVNYTHHSWEENTNEYELDHDFEVDDELEDQVGWFKELKNVTISKSYGDGSIWIKDPWWVDSGERHNPPIYKTFTGSSYSVFLD